MYTWGRMGEIWDVLKLEQTGRIGGKEGRGALIVKGRRVRKHTKSEVYNTHAYTTYTQ